MRLFYFLITILLFASCKPVFVRYTNMPHVENAQRIRIISKSKLKIEVLTHWSPKILRDTTMYYQRCNVSLKPNVVTDTSNCLIYMENKHVIKYKGSYYVKASAFVDYISQDKFQKYINKDIKF